MDIYWIMLRLQEKRPDLNVDLIEKARIKADKMLKNLVHYRSNGKYEDQDLMMLTLELLPPQ